MTMPNKTAGLSSKGMEWAFSADDTIAGDHSIHHASNRTQPIIMDVLKAGMQISGGWLSAVEAAWAGLIRGIPLVTSIFFGILDKIWDLTGLGFLWEPSDILDFISNGLSILGSIIPGLDASKIISGTFPQSIINGLEGALSAITGSIQSLFNNLWNGFNGVVGAVGKGLSDVLSAAQGVTQGIANALSGVGNMIDGAVQGFLGLFGGGWSQSDANNAIQSQAASTTANASAIASILQEQSSNAQAGNSADVDFTLLPNAAVLPVGFTPINSGVGTVTFGVATGQAAMVGEAWNGSRTVTGVYTVLQTMTDYQIIGCVMSAIPARADTSYHTLCGRSNTAGTTRVEAQLFRNKIVLGCFVAGAFTSFTTFTHQLQAGSAYYLWCGTAGGLRIFRVYVNSKLLFAYTEVGTTSQVGSGFHCTCIGVFDKGSRFVANSYEWWDFPHAFPHSYFVYETPGAVSRWLMSDNAIPTYFGTAARFSRLSTATLTCAADVAFPANFLDTIEYCTPDVTWNATTQTATVTKEGVYIIEVGYRSNASAQGSSVVLINGVLRHIGAFSDHTWGQATFPHYLHVNDTVSPGAHVAIVLTGEATGLFSFFTLHRVG